MSDAVIVAATRTPIGRARKGSLVDARPDDLVAFAIDAALKQVPELDRAEVVDVMVGCGFPQERQGMNLARRAALLAGLPASVPGTTVNRFCASSLQTIRMAHPRDQSGRGRRLRRRRRRVDLPSRRLPQGRRGTASQAVRRRRADRQRLHPHGDDRGERGRALERLARGNGPLRAALAGTRGRRPGQRLLRARARSLGRCRPPTTGPGASRHWRSSPSSSPASSPAAR